MNFSINRIIAIIILALTYTIVFYVTKPEYKYEDGKVLILETIKDYKFLEADNQIKTVSVVNNPEAFLIANRAYYYIFSKEGSNIEYIMSPIDGTFSEVKESFD